MKTKTAIVAHNTVNITEKANAVSQKAEDVKQLAVNTKDSSDRLSIIVNNFKLK